eukprot:GEMP01053493.1.p2 GENE.GEMP01053493.1~~GEMP01053493.1.p2  ORF type:complete len:103 (+),score=2.43 GEMP01053493.1:983-1291(+)
MQNRPIIMAIMLPPFVYYYQGRFSSANFRLSESSQSFSKAPKCPPICAMGGEEDGVIHSIYSRTNKNNPEGRGPVHCVCVFLFCLKLGTPAGIWLLKRRNSG